MGLPGLPIPPLTFKGGDAGPSNAGGGMFDSSGWNVNFGSGDIKSSASSGIDLSQWMPYLIGGALLVALRMSRKK